MMEQEHWAIRGLRWGRDHFSNWFANSFVMAGTFGIIIVSIFIGMYFDGEYAQRWSPTEEATSVFRTYGWLISLGMVFFTAVGIKAIQEGAHWAGGAFVAFGIYFTILSITQSIGVVTLKAQEKMAYADAYEKTIDTDTSRLDELKGQRTLLVESRDSEINRIESSIRDIRDDGVNGINANDLAKIDKLNSDIATLRVDADTQIRRVSDSILAELETPESSEGVTVAPSRFDAGIDFWAYVFTFGNPTDEYKEGMTYWYMLFWSIGCPIMGLMLSIYLVITRRTSQNADKKDPRRVEAGKKAWETRKKNEPLPIEDGGYWETRIAKALKTRMKNPTAEGMANTYFGNMTVGELEGHLNLRVKRGQLSPEDRDFILRQGEYAPEQLSNGTDLTPIGQDDVDDSTPDRTPSS